MKIRRCHKCNRVLTQLPTSATCTNRACDDAGKLVERDGKPKQPPDKEQHGPRTVDITEAVQLLESAGWTITRSAQPEDDR